MGTWSRFELHFFPQQINIQRGLGNMLNTANAVCQRFARGDLGALVVLAVVGFTERRRIFPKWTSSKGCPEGINF